MSEDIFIESIEVVDEKKVVICLSPVQKLDGSLSTLIQSIFLLKDRYSQFIFDFGNVDSISHSGLSSVFGFGMNLQSDPDGGMVLCNVPDTLQSDFNERDIAKAYLIVSTVDAAVKAFQSLVVIRRRMQAFELHRLKAYFHSYGYIPMENLVQFLERDLGNVSSRLYFSSQHLSLQVGENHSSKYEIVFDDGIGTGRISVTTEFRDSFNICGGLDDDLEWNELSMSEILQILKS